MAGPFTLIPTEVLQDRNMQQITDFGMTQTTAAAMAAMGLTVPAPSFGGCYEFNETPGSNLLLTSKTQMYQWITGTAGAAKGDPYVSFDAAVGKNLVIGGSGAGTYLVNCVYAGALNTANCDLEAVIYKNAAAQDNLRTDQFVPTVATYQTGAITGLLVLAAADTVSLRFGASEDNRTLNIRHVNLCLTRVGW